MTSLTQLRSETLLMNKVRKSPTAKQNNLFDVAFGEKQKDDPI